MKKIQNSTALTLGVIHGTAFSVFFVVEKILNEIFYPFLEQSTSKLVMISISAVVALVLYGVVYFIVKKIYDILLLRNEPKLNIEGEWFHVHIPHYLGKEDYSQERLSVGTTTVSRELKDFTFVGNNQKCYMLNGEMVMKTENSTHWYTKATKLSDENDFDLIEIYEAKTRGEAIRKITSCPYCKRDFAEPVEIQEAEKFRHGIHKIDIIEQSGIVTGMIAEYSDCWPSLKNGELLFYRTRKERDDRIKLFFAEAEKAKQ